MGKNMQIPEAIFGALVKIHLGHSQDPAVHQEVCDWLTAKLQAKYRRNLYTQSKDTSLTPEEREQARTAYLDEKGISEDFRW